MIGWRRFEQRWGLVLFEAMLPGLGEVELECFWRSFVRSAPPLLRFGLRATVWTLTWISVFSLRFRPFFSLSPAERDDVLARAGSSRFYLLRQMTVTLKVVCCFAYFGDPRVRRTLEGGLDR